MTTGRDKNRHYIKTCVDRRFKWNGQAFEWSDPLYKFRITVEPTRTQTGTDIVRVTITDVITSTTVSDWSHDIICGEGDWRDRLQALVGKLSIKAQHRPFCPYCNAPLRVKSNKEATRQFFGCRNYQGGRGCRHTKDLDSAFEPQPRANLKESHKEQGGPPDHENDSLTPPALASGADRNHQQQPPAQTS